tara:strand:- start:139 stop:525 length:387 start_codon:yes stop_codon:yes gene_type:complete
MENKTLIELADLLNEIRNPQTETELAEEHREELEEGSEIHKSDIAPSDMARIKTLEKLFSATFEQFNEGGHGSIVDLNFKNMYGGGNRIMADEWLSISKQIKKLKIRWIQVYNARVSVGLVSINEYDY